MWQPVRVTKGSSVMSKDSLGVITAVTWVMGRELIMEIVILQIGMGTCIGVHRQLHPKTLHMQRPRCSQVFLINRRGRVNRMS